MKCHKGQILFFCTKWPSIFTWVKTRQNASNWMFQLVKCHKRQGIQKSGEAAVWVPRMPGTPPDSSLGPERPSFYNNY